MTSKQTPKKLTLVAAFDQNNVKKRFEDMLGKRAAGFTSSVLQAVNNNKLLKTASIESIMGAAATAASLNLPINPNLGFAYLVPYGSECQFQIGWKGFVQLALRTNQYKNINVVLVYENQFKSWNALTEELDADFHIEGEGKVVGYAAYFRLTSGFEKTVYWTREKTEAHAKKYSKSYAKGFGVWADGEDGFNAMGLKTVLKNTISKWGIMSVDMEHAVQADQSVQLTEGEHTYPDNDYDEHEVVEEKKAAMKKAVKLP